MTALKPYLIRAVYDWLNDNQLTPYLLVNANYEGTVVPQQFVDNGQIILNVRPQAVHNLFIGEDRIEFNARFGGSAMHLFVPIPAVLAMYAKENGRGMVFDGEEPDTDTPSPTPPEKPKTTRPNLRVVK